MRYDYLTKEERQQLRDQRQQQITDELRGLEQQHYQRELDYRIAAGKNPVDQETMDAARADQGALDARYAALSAALDAFKARGGG